MALPNYGSPEGLSERLDEWCARVRKDKGLPWIGMGILADMETAAALLRGDPAPAPRTAAPAAALEFDL